MLEKIINIVLTTLCITTFTGMFAVLVLYTYVFVF